MTILETVTNYIVFNNAVAVGYDKTKCLEGIEDLTRLKDVDNSKPWHDKLVACKIIDIDAKTAIERYNLAEINFIRVDKNIQC
jgi:hypothetical protein